MITIEEMYLRNAISGNSSPQYEKVVEFPFQAHEIALVLIGVRSCRSSPFSRCTPILEWSE